MSARCGFKASRSSDSAAVQPVTAEPLGGQLGLHFSIPTSCLEVLLEMFAVLLAALGSLLGEDVEDSHADLGGLWSKTEKKL